MMDSMTVLQRPQNGGLMHLNVVLDAMKLMLALGLVLRVKAVLLRSHHTVTISPSTLACPLLNN